MRWNRWGIWAIVALAATVVIAVAAPLPGERAVTAAFRSLGFADGLWHALNGFVTDHLAFGIAILVVTGLIYLFVPPPREAIVPLAGLMGAIAIEWVLKPIVQRPRPGIFGPLLHGFSFPSGGALYWAAWLGSVAVVVMRRVKADLIRRVLVTVLLTVAVLGGVARLAAGAHWFLDVIGSWLWAAAWVFWLRGATRQMT